MVLLVVDGWDSKRCPLYSRHGPSELRKCIGEKTARSSGGERELAPFEKMAFFKTRQAVVSEREGGFRELRRRTNLKSKKMSGGPVTTVSLQQNICITTWKGRNTRLDIV